MFLDTIKKIFVKEEVFECIIWDGKTMKYQDLTQKQIDEIRNNPECKDWSVTLKDEC
jgi:hypothetical protein